MEPVRDVFPARMYIRTSGRGLLSMVRGLLTYCMLFAAG